MTHLQGAQGLLLQAACLHREVPNTNLISQLELYWFALAACQKRDAYGDQLYESSTCPKRRLQTETKVTTVCWSDSPKQFLNNN